MSDTSFVNNISAGVNALGLRNTPIVYSLAKIDWKSPEDRDAVLAFITEDTNG